ncbi:Putrescine transport system permease protein PotH [Pseudovibrio axinellae]|uniref:Putrescine transport system permease protein PotH n=1 Tax=Pseudovibrio axinellae TaxID=989403 RepID=A0A161UGE4_9HYPH|nr:ABC transporter permease subunit [Pseudovibrio axinellae]KZL04583.1 Putrescine transport system permease protein PotH [Pseudovibrio axinellae]SEQ72303.1 putrescine transport system permease protein [Pseudovibrio axinellae]
MALADITTPSQETEQASVQGSGWRRSLLIAVPYIWLLVFFLAPFVIVLKISLSDVVLARPPYFPTFDISEGWQGFVAMFQAFDLENYVWLTEDTLYLKSYLSSLKIAFISTMIALVLGYPIAYALAKAPKEWRSTLLMLVILPFWTSFLIRVYAWIGILKKEGVLNYVLLWSGIIDEPLTILNTDAAIYIGIVYSYLPFMILPLYAVLEKLDYSLLEAATDLGCSPFKAFWVITLPLSVSGIWAGCFLVFIPAVGEFVIPDILGGSSTIMIGKTLWVEFFSNRDWPVASAVAILLLIMLIMPIILFQKQQEKQAEASQ